MMQRKNSNVIQYMECSAWNDYGVKEVFEEAVRVALKFRNNSYHTSSNERKCCIL